MKKSDIIEKALDEIANKHFAVTEQYLQIHELVYEDNKPKIERVDTESKDGTAIVYLPIKGEKFFFVIYLDTNPEIAVRYIGTEPYSSVRFVATSEVLNLQELSGLTTLKSFSGKNKGDKRGITGNVFWNYSSISIEPNPEPDEFEDKLRKLLDYLEQDKEGILSLVEKANGYVQAAIEFHNGNTMLGGPHLNSETIKRMAKLNLAIDFDLYVGGNLFKNGND